MVVEEQVETEAEMGRSFGEDEVVARLVAVDEFDISHGESWLGGVWVEMGAHRWELLGSC